MKQKCDLDVNPDLTNAAVENRSELFRILLRSKLR